jgi:sugar phosphate isomerase/epimerase
VGIDDDLGGWRGSGTDPVAATRLFHGHIAQVRVSDVDAGGKPVVVGTGAVDVAAVLSELKAGGFKGVIAIACKPGGGATVIEPFIASVNALSDAIAKVAGE